MNRPPPLGLDNASNKRILWDILKDNHVFDKMKNTQYTAVKNTFDMVVATTSKHIEKTCSYYTIVEKNKLIIEQLIPAIENIQVSSHHNTSHTSPPSMKIILGFSTVPMVKRLFSDRVF